MKTLVCLLLLTTAAILAELKAASVEDWLKSGLLHPDLISEVSADLKLTEEQQTRLKQQLDSARQQAEPLERMVRTQQKALNRLLQDSATTAEAAAGQLAKLMEAEAAVKQLQLRALIGVRDVLTPEQLALAKKIGPQKMAGITAGQTAPAIPPAQTAVMQKVAKLKTALEALGTPPTEAMKQRGSEVETLIKQGDFKAADAALDRLIADAKVNELDAEPAAVDFAMFEPGSTDVDSLMQRYEAVRAAGQEVISLALMRQLLQAKDAFEQAKEAQDAEKVGRILTYVESLLKQP